ncbi:helix-turn-helix domain-containing protein [Corynebacterium mastitidis]
METNLKINAPLLSTARETAGLSITELAQLTKVSYTTLASWEQDQKTPGKLDLIKRVGTHLGLSLHDLVHLTDRPTPATWRSLALLNIANAAKQISLTTHQISQIENGLMAPTMPEVRAMSQAYQAPAPLIAVSCEDALRLQLEAPLSHGVSLTTPRADTLTEKIELLCTYDRLPGEAPITAETLAQRPGAPAAHEINKILDNPSYDPPLSTMLGIAGAFHVSLADLTAQGTPALFTRLSIAHSILRKDRLFLLELGKTRRVRQKTPQSPTPATPAPTTHTVRFQLNEAEYKALATVAHNTPVELFLRKLLSDTLQHDSSILRLATTLQESMKQQGLSLKDGDK